jgi:hypothetical protein
MLLAYIMAHLAMFNGLLTASRVFFARSLTKGLAMMGMRAEAGMWPFSLLARSADMVMRYEGSITVRKLERKKN